MSITRRSFFGLGAAAVLSGPALAEASATVMVTLPPGKLDNGATITSLTSKGHPVYMKAVTVSDRSMQIMNFDRGYPKGSSPNYLAEYYLEDGTQISSNEIDPSNGNPSLAKNTRRPLA